MILRYQDPSNRILLLSSVTLTNSEHVAPGNKPTTKTSDLPFSIHAAASLLYAVVAASGASAADRHWDPNGTAPRLGGAGVWDTTSTNWSQSSDGTTGPYVLWNSAANDTAIFGGTAGAVTIGGAVSTRFLTFQTDGYSLSNGTLTFTGTAPAITINGADTRVSISSTIIGNAIISDPETSDALIIRGGGTLVLTGNTTTNGLARIAGAHVRLEGGGQINATNTLLAIALNEPRGSSSLTVTGPGSVLTTGGLQLGWINRDDEISLNIVDGGKLIITGNNSNFFGRFGPYAMTITTNVAGQGSELDASNSDIYIAFGHHTNTFNVTDGGKVRSLGLTIGGPFHTATYPVALTISGQGSSWAVGEATEAYLGTISVVDGGRFDTENMAFWTTGTTAGASQGIISGAGSEFTVRNNLRIGRTAAREASVTVTNNGKLSAGTLFLAEDATGVGTLNIGAAAGEAATASGEVIIPSIIFGEGIGTITFNHTDTDYELSSAMSSTADGQGRINILSGVTRFTGDSSTFSGTTSIEGGALYVNGRLGGLVSVGAAGRLGGTGEVGNVDNAGIVAPGNSIGTLTVAGDYVGNGGTIEIETVLGDDTSPTDMLVVNGNTSGSTTVTVINNGGLGAPTQEGIKIIDVAGNSDGVFTLNGDYVLDGEPAVVAGAYAYRLYKNGITDPNDGDWYLRSQMTASGSDPNTGGGSGGGNGGSGGSGTGGGNGTGAGPNSGFRPQPSTEPLYQPGVPLYESYAGVLREVLEPDTLQQRLGTHFWGTATGVFSRLDRLDGVWARIGARHATSDAYGSTSRASYDASSRKLSAGADFSMFENALGTLIGGLYVQHGTVASQVQSPHGNGTIETAGLGFGATLTWYGENGFYADGRALFSRFDSHLHSSTTGRRLVSDNRGRGESFSLELGQRFELSNGWSLTPQAQLIHSTVSFDPFTDAFGASVKLDTGSWLVGRAGIAINRDSEWQSPNGKRRLQVYGISNLMQDIRNESQVNVEGVRFLREKQSLDGALGIGGTFSWADGRFAIYGEANASTNLERIGSANAYAGTVGFRMKW